MQILRLRLVQRLCAALLLAGVGATLVPTAEALDVRVEALGSLLGDRDAVASALDAAQTAPTPEVAAERFAVRYAAEASRPVSEAAILELLLGQAFRHVAPVLPDVAFVPTPTATVAPRVGPPGMAVAVDAPSLPAPPSVPVAWTVPPVVSRSAAAVRTHPTRGP